MRNYKLSIVRAPAVSILAVLITALTGTLPTFAANEDSPGSTAMPFAASKEKVGANGANGATPAATPIAALVEGRVPTPSVEQVMDLVQEQGQEIAALRAALREQQELSARLEARLDAGPPAPVVAAAVALTPAISAASLAVGSTQTELEQKIAQIETNIGKSQKNLEERIKKIGPFTFSGDFRLRAEPTFGGPLDQSQQRFRQRVRLRFNVETKLNDQIRGGFSVASGDLNSPISTSQTLNQFESRKPLAIDRMYATYTPSWFKPLTLTGGKFMYTWFNTEMVWDKDLNPEGASETLSFNVKTPALKNISFVGFQSPVAKVQRTPANDKSYYNTVVYGEQVQTYWQLGERVRLSAYESFYDWKFADSVAFSLLEANSASPEDGLLPLANLGEVNSIATLTSTNSITGAKTLASAQFASKFAILDSLAEIDVATRSERWPITFIGDFAENTRACENVKNISLFAVYSAPCDPHARHGYWLETSVGRARKRGDWQFSYTRMMIQREAVLGAFNYSEIFPTSNVEMHRPEISYQLFDNVTLQLNGLFGRPLVNAGSPAPVQPLWERLQFDMTYKF
ncbi:MAG TPA: putative porin [Candidatus Acidoferrales bacterium]|nr:putative porin [Candidatus Acidoferrales bacterium]